MVRIFLKLIRLQFVVVIAAALSVSGQTAQQENSNSPSAVCDVCSNPPYKAITGKQRLHWFVHRTVGPEDMLAGLFSAGIGTATDSPREYGGTWEGYGKRYGMRLTGVSTGNAMEAGFGALWGEDPRYFRAAGEPFGNRVRHVFQMTFAARQRDGTLAPAYARYIGIAGNNFLSNTWRADSEADLQHAGLRTLYGFLGEMGGNAFREFWPDLKRRVFAKSHK